MCMPIDSGASDGVEKPDSSSASSPQDQIEGRILDVSPEPSQSLASFQRSKSRKRALELRNSAKAVRSQLLVDNNAGLFASGKTGRSLVVAESRKEELVLGPVLPGPQPAACCSSNDLVPYNKPAFISENEELPNGFNREVHALQERSHSDCLPLSNAQSAWDIKKPFTSPEGKLWDRITSNPGSSENRVKRELLADVTENPNLPASTSEAEISAARNSLEYVNTEYSFTGTCNGVNHRKSSKRGQTNKAKVSNSLSIGKYGINRVSESVHIVQQKQTAAIVTGKRNVNVKSLKAAKAAMRREQELNFFLPGPVKIAWLWLLLLSKDKTRK
ncbi:hypothetical protein ACOSQ4_016750 [Xanthoceras sorbifolium]